MTVTWSSYKTQVRRSILKDPAGSKWSDDMLKDFMGWALDALCAHTAYATGTSYAGDGETTTFSLPSNIYLPLDQAGLVTVQDGAGAEIPKYLLPVFSSYGLSPNDERGYLCWQDDQIVTNVPVDDADSLVVYYYAYYTHPVSDTDLVTAPMWAHAALSYRIGAYALAQREISEAKISTFDDKRDSGTPEDSATRLQAEAWIKRWYEELAAHPKQVRKQAPSDQRAR